jgi:methionyl-tRNA synthetase
MEAVRVVAVMLAPVTPSLSRRIYMQLGFSDEVFASLTWEDTKWGCIGQGQTVPKPEPVFARLEGDFVTAPAAKEAGA